MKNMTKHWTKVVVSVLLFILCVSFPAEAVADEPSLKALIVTGQSNPWHKWEVSSPILEQLLD